MSRFFDQVSKPVRVLGEPFPAVPPRPAADVPSQLIHLDSNENPFGPSPRALEAMRAILANAHAYPDDECRELCAKLAALHQIPEEQVLVTAGSSALIALLCQTLLAPGLNAVTSERSFIVYGMAVKAAGGHLVETPMRDDGFDLGAILNAVTEDTRIVFLANPNNPTGTMLDAKTLEQFIAEIPQHVVVVLDEAYYDYAAHFAEVRQTEYSRSLDHLRPGAGVVVLRTFSKAHGLAGLRIGYGFGPAELMAYCARIQNTFSVSSVAQAAALAALDDPNHVKRTVLNNAAQAQILLQGIAELGFRAIPTWTNFLYCDVGGEASDFASRLRELGVSVRALGVWGAPNYIRVSIGMPEQNQAFLKAARRIAEKPPE